MAAKESGAVSTTTPQTRVQVVCGGKTHAYDFVLRHLHEQLAAQENLVVDTSSDYTGVDLGAVDVLVTYTCELRPTLEEQLALRGWVEAGGRWFALHATNAAFDVVRNSSGVTLAVPRFLQVLHETLGSHFLAHPPLGPFQVDVTTPDHPLVKGIAPFTVTDELYLAEYHTEVEVLLHARFAGEALAGFPHSYWPEEADHPVMYLRHFGDGEILYLNLGHSRNDNDDPVPDGTLPTVVGSWASPEFNELVRRGIDWELDSARTRLATRSG
jgi:uncharacterized protein